MAELNQIGVVGGIPNSGTGEVPTLAVVRDRLDLVLAAVQKLAPATDLTPVTPNDSTTLTGVRSLYVGTGGDLVVTINGHDRTLENVPDGFILSAQVTKVKAATTASGIIAYV
jgi:hypothetical protein